MIEKTPRAHGRQIPLRQYAFHEYATHAAERHLPSWIELRDRARAGLRFAQRFLGMDFQVAHGRASLTLSSAVPDAATSVRALRRFTE